MEKARLRVSGFKDGLLVEYSGHDVNELANTLVEYLGHYGSLVGDAPLYLAGQFPDDQLRQVKGRLREHGFSVKLVSLGSTEIRPQRRKVETRIQKVLFELVPGPIRGGNSFQSKQGVLLWGDLHEGAELVALSAIVMGKARGRVVVPPSGFVALQESEGASVQVGETLYLDVTSNKWLIITDSESGALQVISDEKQVGRRISEWLDNAL